MKQLPSRPRSDGFTLVEVLIAVVVFSIGLLGIAGLQVSGMRFTQGSQLRSIAAMQTSSMADRMRANRVGVLNGAYNSGGTMPSSSAKDCALVSCTPAEAAAFDLVNWNLSAGSSKPAQSNADLLPEGSGVVCIDATPDDGTSANWACDGLGAMYAIKVTWNERTANASDGAGDTEAKRMVMRVMQ